MVNPEQTIITQYQASPVMSAILSNWAANIDPTPDIINFYNIVWNVTTASGYGLDVWGRIVGATRTFQSTQNYNYFTFNGVTGAQPFGTYPFYAGQGSTTLISLSDSDFRTLIFLKAAANVSNCSAPFLNAVLRALYSSRGEAYVLEASVPGQIPMTFTYVFKFALSSVDFAILTESGALPRPAGVAYSILQGA